jgi:DNA-binding response OmpR family regulator
MARILLVDDDPNLLDMLSMAFEDAGHDVQTARDGAKGHKKAAQGDVELLVSDVNMPGLDGFSLCRKLRAEGFSAPIILLTARDSEIDEALGLELGADDYVAKPFSTRVLLARVAALLRRDQMRAAPAASAGEAIRAGALDLDLERMEARYAGQLFETTVTEFRLLCALARRPGVVLTREQLLERIRGDDSVVAERLIDTYVRRLRRKIEAIDPTFDEIDTMIGAGYRWKG